jgi:hypothetical protein
MVIKVIAILRRVDTMKSKLFTIRVKPYVGESLTSYLFRLTKSNGMKILQLWKTLKVNSTEHYVQRNEIHLIDFAPTNSLNMEKLAKSIGVEENLLLRCTFYNIIRLFCGDKEIERVRFLSGMIRQSLHYCPKCLKEKRFNHLVWKIEGIDGCIKHGDKLLKQCSFCNNEIKYSQIVEIGKCPHCEKCLGECCSEKMDQDEQEKALWYYQAWTSLLINQNDKTYPAEIAMRILFLLNKKEDVIDIELIENNMENSGFLPTLLQHARQSLVTERTLHISFILTTLKKNKVGIEEFLEINVPDSFIKSLKSRRETLKESTSCIAPWCPSFKKTGSLIKTGTSLKKREKGNVLKYYLICNKCGCEYAFNEQSVLEERGYFIESYNRLNNESLKNAGLKEIVENTRFTDDKVKRSLAYFRSRNVLDDVNYFKGYIIKEELLNNFIKAVQIGEQIKSISKWECWEGYEDFLTYRYHINVMQALNKKEDKKVVVELKPEKTEEVNNVLEYMYEHDEDITLGTVCEKLGVCAETIRNWGCNGIIAKMKDQQKTKRVLERKTDIYSKIDNFFKRHGNKKISANEIYDAIDYSRTLLWRFAPEITAYISNRRKMHNSVVYVEESY